MKTMNKTSRIFGVIAFVLCLTTVICFNVFATETDNVVEGEVIEIRTWDDLKALDARVEGGDMLEGVTVKLMNDIDLYELGEGDEPVTFNPIGANKAYFKGTFDGQGHTIKNMYQSGWALGYHWDNYGTIGLFAYIWNATIKNVVIENAECLVEGGNVAAIAGCAWGDCTFENITVKNSTFATYNNRAAGIVGYTGGEGTMTFNKITVDEETVIAGLWGSFDSSLGGVVGSIQDPTKFTFEDVTVACRLDAYNDVTAAYQYYAYRMCGMLIGKIPVDSSNQPILDNVTIGENVVIDYSKTPDYVYVYTGSDSKSGWNRVEAGYAYGGVDLTQYPDAEVIYKPFNSMFGGQQLGSYGQDDHEDIEAIGRVASFDGEYFTSLETAIKAADGAIDSEGNAVPVKLMADYDDDIVITESLNLDLNGYSFTGNVTTVYGYKVVLEDGKYTAVEIPKHYVATKAELNAALAAANEGEIIILTADIDYGTDQLKLEKAITLDLGGFTLTTAFNWGGMSVKGNPTIKNGTIIHTGNTAAIKVWNATAFEDLTIEVSTYTEGKVKGGIVLQEGSTTRVDSIKNVTIKGAGLTNGIETYNCGDAQQDVIGALENVTIDANGTGMLISAPCGTATNCTIEGGENGIEIWIKGTYSASLDLVDCDVKGGVFAHDEFTSNPDAVNNGTLEFAADENTTGADAEDITLTIARAEKVEGDLKEIKESAVAQVNGTYYATVAKAIAAAQAGDTVKVFEGTYTMPSMKAGIAVEGVGNVLFEGTLSGTLENLTLKNIHIKGSNAQRWAYAKGNLVFENVTFEATSVYALHFDGITAGATLLYKDCTIIGWAAMSGSPESVVFDGCTIKGNGSYGLIRTYFDATIENCTFDVSNVNADDQYQDGIHSVDATVTVENCTNVNGDMKDIIDTSKAGYIVLDGESIHFHKFVQGETVAPTFDAEGYTLYICPCGTEEKQDPVPALIAVAEVNDVKYETLQGAVSAAGENDIIYILIETDEEITVPEGYELISGTDANNNKVCRLVKTAMVPVIKDGFWWIGGVNTGVPATGAPGQDGSDGANGEDGKDGADGEDGITPAFKVENGAIYVSYDEGATWTKLADVAGEDGADGANGENGKDGADGEDGITPAFKVENGAIYVSYDEGATWTKLADVAGEDGADGANGEDGKDGKDGKDGVTPLLRINTETHEWEVSYDNGQNWESLGVKVPVEEADKDESPAEPSENEGAFSQIANMLGKIADLIAQIAQLITRIVSVVEKLFAVLFA